MRESVTPHITTSLRVGAPRYGNTWWLYHDQEMMVVFNAWNIGGGPSLPLYAVQERLSRAER